MLLDRATADDMALAERAAQEIAYQYQLLIWTVCHPGPGKPFDVEEERPLPPDWTDLYGVENLLICKAHMNVNGHRLQTLETLIAPKKRKPGVEQRPSWSVFIGSLAVQLKKDPRTLMCDTSLAELLATVKLAAPPEPEKKKSA
jgi:hypothetical protein